MLKRPNITRHFRVSHSERGERGGGGMPPAPPSKPMKSPQLKNKPPALKSEVPFQEIIPTKNPYKSETVIKTCVLIIKQQWKKMAEIPQEHDFLTWSIQNFLRKV